MRKFLTGLIIVVLAVGIALAVAWPYLKMEFSSSAYYTEKDRLEYEYYTPELLKKMPRISAKYEFDFANISGPEAHVFTVRFYDVTETQVIRDYLKSAGYEPQKSCDVEAECWRSHTSNDVVTVANILSQKGIFVQIYRSPYTEPLIDSKG
ncbi:hypothetical protein JMY81_09730 [Brenneria goodwinii]|uniref:hypothetical protein n=1 Tax=Brenneria goodwinii TaxID=1109412 RepID=UPI000EF1AB7D|nr:hypothetical protein [Brenneria goodwinii]MCG8157640.1 hypothetical protein [Brenneria goodwinii]MCG8161119.1 hypothetical protein [Brenneria goodwinii]MCG8165463.1 hypothetical protein [Brenneria goodwinii]MCG8169946.1 hypothetical protein [Brenneria goodwinii]MCG8177452.1 hypothetical protein [Brenneria goodwinii]